MQRSYCLDEFTRASDALCRRQPEALGWLTTLGDAGCRALTGLWTRTHLGFSAAVVARIEEDAPGRVAAMQAPIPSCWLRLPGGRGLVRVQDDVDLWTVFLDGQMACTTQQVLEEPTLAGLLSQGQRVQTVVEVSTMPWAHSAWVNRLGLGPTMVVDGTEDVVLASRLHWLGGQRSMRSMPPGTERMPVSTLRGLPTVPAEGVGWVGDWALPL